MKRSRKRVGLILMVLMLASMAYAQPKVVSLTEAIEYAIQNNSVTKNAQLNITDAEAQIIERRAIGMPKLNGNFNFTHYLKVPLSPLPESFNTFGAVFGDLMPLLSESTQQLLMSQNSGGDSEGVAFVLKNNITASLDLDVMVFDGSYFVGLQAAKAYRKFAAQELLTKEREVRNKVVDAYYPALLVDETLEILDRNIANLEKLRFETNELYKAGFAEQLDVDRLDLSLTNLSTEKANLQRQREIAIAALKFAMNYPQDAELDLAEDLEELLTEAPEGSLTDAVNYQARPEVGLVDEALRLNEYNVRLYKAGYLPTLNGFGTYQQSYFGNDLKSGFWAPATLVGLRLNVPIFDGFEKKAKIQRARIDLEEVVNQKSDLIQSISFEVQNARISYLNAKERLDSQNKNMDLANRIYNTTQIKYREGVGSSLELSQAEQDLYNTQRNYIQALYDLAVARAELQKALNIPIKNN